MNHNEHSTAKQCKICSTRRNIVKHHLSYEPEVTVPLCRSHHAKVHRNPRHPLHPIKKSSPILPSKTPFNKIRKHRHISEKSDLPYVAIEKSSEGFTFKYDMPTVPQFVLNRRALDEILKYFIPYSNWADIEGLTTDFFAGIDYGYFNGLPKRAAKEIAARVTPIVKDRQNWIDRSSRRTLSKESLSRNAGAPFAREQNPPNGGERACS